MSRTGDILRETDGYKASLIQKDLVQKVQPRSRILMQDPREDAVIWREDDWGANGKFPRYEADQVGLRNDFKDAGNIPSGFIPKANLARIFFRRDGRFGRVVTGMNVHRLECAVLAQTDVAAVQDKNGGKRQSRDAGHDAPRF